MPVFDNIDAHIAVIEAAYAAAFADPSVQSLRENGIMAVLFQEEQVWWHVSWHGTTGWRWASGPVNQPDVAITYKSAKTFYTQFWDNQQFMYDALQGDVILVGSTEKAAIFSPLAAPFQQKYRALTSEDGSSPI